MHFIKQNHSGTSAKETIMKFLRTPISPFYRWLAFNSVGALGIVVQMGTLFLLVGIFDMNYLLATAIAVEAAVLHNFLWHENWTWADRANACRHLWLRRLVYFHLANGMFSLLGNLVLMRLFVGVMGMNYALANLIAICLCAIMNYLAGDRFVFRAAGKLS
jgi:putative flippase GtrA